MERRRSGADESRDDSNPSDLASSSDTPLAVTATAYETVLETVGDAVFVFDVELPVTESPS